MYLPDISLSDSNENWQVQDDLDLLEAMLNEQSCSDAIYQPTNYWSGYCEAITNFIRKNGLENFRRNPGGFFNTFGAADVLPGLFQFVRFHASSATDQQIFTNTLQAMNAALAKNLPVLPFGVSMTELVSLGVLSLNSKKRGASARPAEGLDLSRYGNPMGFEIDGAFKPASFFHYYPRYLYASQFVDFDQIDLLVEVGAGSGKQIEIIKRLHPHLTVIILDLASQLYVCERFLAKALPDHVVPYESGSTHVEAGKVHFWNNRRIEHLPVGMRTLFWNAASFGEMEPEIVENYAKFAGRAAQSCYLMQRFDGKEIAAQAGSGGVIKQTKLDDYRRLFGDFNIVDMAPAYSAFAPEREGADIYHESIWRRA